MYIYNKLELVIINNNNFTAIKVGGIWLFFGCRTRTLDLYKDEKDEMVKKEVIQRKFLALSREPSIPKVTNLSN